MMRRVHAALVALVLGVAGAWSVIGSQQSAQANTGDFEAGVYYQALGGDTRASIESRCGCTGARTDRNDGSIVMAYNADNASFAWDVTYIEITFHWKDGAWKAYNGWYFGEYDGKMRYSPTRSPYQFYDPINFTG